MDNKKYIESLDMLADDFEEKAKKLRCMADKERENIEDGEVTPAGVKKALDLCSCPVAQCAKCPYKVKGRNCRDVLTGDALKLINNAERHIDDCHRDIDNLHGFVRCERESGARVARKQTAIEIRKGILGGNGTTAFKVPYKKKYSTNDVISICQTAVTDVVGRIKDICKKIEEE